MASLPFDLDRAFAEFEQPACGRLIF